MTMGCNCSFSAVTGTIAADPSRHVNYVTGMILGVDDYAQEFAYHAGRAKRIVREFLGYGTVLGLALSVADSGAGPRVTVGAGSAAAPSGQLICVGRDQCGEINAWLKRPEIKAELDARAGTDNALDLQVHLTLCYTDCAVEDVPIPGEPCRSEENLMAPSRRADDYCLSFALEPPLQTESRALAVTEAWLAATEAAVDAGGTDDPAQFPALLARARVQIMAALGLAPGELDPADLAPVVLTAAAFAGFEREIRKAWVTVLRPLVMAEGCASPAATADDCVLIGTLRMEVTRGVDPTWVAPAVAAITIDESQRPLVIAAMALQSPLAARLAPPPGDLAIKWYNDDSPDFEPAPAVSVIVAGHAAAMTITMPVGQGEQTHGDTVVLVHASAQPLTLKNAKRGTDDPAVLGKRGRFRLTYNGTDAWRVTAIVEEEG